MMLPVGPDCRRGATCVRLFAGPHRFGECGTATVRIAFRDTEGAYSGNRGRQEQHHGFPKGPDPEGRR